MNVTLSENEKCLLDSINTAYDQVMLMNQFCDISLNSSESKKLIELIQIGVRSMISFFRLNADFQVLTEDLQIILTKKSIVESLLLLAVIYYNPTNNNFDDYSSNTILSSKSLIDEYGPIVYTKIMCLIKDMHKLAEGNQLILKIMLMTILFSPNVIEIDFQKRHLISNYHVKYINLLYSYMNFKFGPVESELKFSNYLCYLREIFGISTIIRCHTTNI
jgi:hypothetical protein